MARGGAGDFDHLRDGPEWLVGVFSGRPLPVGAGQGPLGGAPVSLDWRGLGVERSIVWAEGALGVQGAGRPSSPTSMASSLSEEGLDTAFVGRWGGLGLRRNDWSRPAFSAEGIVVVTILSSPGDTCSR